MSIAVLIVESSQIEAEGIASRLRLLGHDVCGVYGDLEVALVNTGHTRPDLVLLDIDQIDRVQHPDAVARIRDRWDCPVVLTSAALGTPGPEDSTTSELAVLLPKPIQHDRELDGTIRLALKHFELEKTLCPQRRTGSDQSYPIKQIDSLVAELAHIHRQLRQVRSRQANGSEPLQYSETLFRTIIHHTPVGMVLVGHTGEFTMVNSRFCDFLGYDEGELLQMTSLDILHPADVSGVEADDASPAKGQSSVTCGEKRFLRKDGRFVTGHLGVTNITDETGQTVYHLWQVEDVTDRKRAEQERLKLESIVERSPDLIAMITMSGHFRYINPTGMKLVGATVPSNQMAVIDITDPGTEDNTLVDLCEKVRQNGLWRGELSLRRMSDGRCVPVAAHGFVLHSSTPTSQPIVALIARDLTEAKEREAENQKLQDQLIRAEKMHSLGMLAGGVAHDLNNILGPLVAYPDLVLRKLPPDSPLRAQIERMRDSACSAAGVVQDLLTLARRGRHERLPVNLNQIVESFLASPLVEKLRADSPDTAVDAHLSESQPVVLGTAAQLEKLIMNLVVNAFDAIVGTGTVTVTTGVRRLSELSTGYSGLDSGLYAFVSVKDDGIGIASRDLKKIFEPYYSTKKMKGRSGTGLGLAIVYGIIKDHKGYYDLISEPGKGTEFVVYLLQAVAPQAPSDPADDLCGSSRLLVVDDDAQQRNVARECLECFGYSVETVASGQEAVELCEREDFDLVLLDMVMDEDFDGLDTFCALKKQNENVRAIIVSGSAASERVRGAQQLGAGKYVQKPYTAEQLAEAVRDELERSPAPL